MWVDWWNDRSLQQNAVVHDRCITLTFCLKTTLHNNLFLKSYKTHCALVPNIRQLNHKVIEKPILPVCHWQTSVWDFAMKWYRAASSFVVTVIEWKQHQNFTRVQNALKFQEHTSQYSGDYVALQCEKTIFRACLWSRMRNCSRWMFILYEFKKLFFPDIFPVCYDLRLTV